MIFFMILIPIAYADDEVSEEKLHQLDYKNTIVLKGNPSTLMTIPSLNYSLHFSKMKAGISFRPLVSITQFRPGIDVDFAPFRYVKIVAGYERAFYFKSLFSYGSPNSDWSDSSRSRSTGLSTTGNFLNATLQIELPIDKFVFRNRFKLTYATFDMEGTAQVVYDELLDIPLPIEGLSYTNETDALYISSPKWVFGLRYTTSKAFVDLNDDPNGSTHRIGPLVSHVFYTDNGGFVDSISGFILLNWYIKHRYRTGLGVSQLLPYSAIGFSITGTLL